MELEFEIYFICGVTVVEGSDGTIYFYKETEKYELEDENY